MSVQNMPDSDRWDGWVTFAWLLAILACIGGIAVIAMAGFIEVPRQNRFGRIETVREANVLIWSLGIGQAVSAVMLAVLFSMVNAIYKNSCSLFGVENNSVASESQGGRNGSWPASHSDQSVHSGPKVVKISDKSPLFDKAYVDWSLAGINGNSISASKDIKEVMKPGENNFTFIKPDGEKVSIIAKVSPNLRLHMTLSR